MRELEAVRHRVWSRFRVVAAPAGLLTLTLGCGPAQQDGKQGGHEAGHAGEHVEGKMGLPPRRGARDHDGDGASGEHDDDHDPADHADEERERCPSGTWCAEIVDAELFSIEGAERELRCPKRLVANPSVEIAADDERFDGFSRSIDMRADLDRTATLGRRNAGEGDMCCYDWLEHCLGRPPLRHDGAVMPSEARDAWVRRARLEWFSVASFVRMAEALVDRGAPSSLVRAHVDAAKQEQRHAELCCGVAGIEPGDLPELPQLEPLDDRLVVREALVSGAIGESLAVLEAHRALALATGRERRVWQTIARDEAGHAALGMATIGWWAQRAGTELIADEVRRLLESGLGRESRAIVETIVRPLLTELGLSARRTTKAIG